MSTKQGGKAKPLKKPKSDKKDYDEVDMANIQKKKEEEKVRYCAKGVESQGATEGKLWRFWAQEKWKEIRALYHDCIHPILSPVVYYHDNFCLIVAFFIALMLVLN
ncbi:hypothetical protein HKD37_08G022384 [Glycine soja]